MSKLTRIKQKVFGSTGGATEFGQFGSNQANPPGNTTKDLDTIQALSNYDQGWYAATANAAEPPRIQDRNGLDLLFSSQLAYLFQNGIPEWLNDAEQRYYANVSIVQVAGNVYIAIQGDDLSNINAQKNPVTETAWWRLILSKNGAVNLTGNQTIDGIKTFINTTESTSKDSGALVTEGGVGIEKDLNVGGNVVFGSEDDSSERTLGELAGDKVPMCTLQATNTNRSYLEIYEHRVVDGDDWSTASTVIQKRIDEEDMAYIEFNPSGVPRGLIIGGPDGEIARFDNAKRVRFSGTTESTSKDTGALVVEGGVGIEKDLNVGGTIGLPSNSIANGNTNAVQSNDVFDYINEHVWPVGSTYIQFPGDSDPSALGLPGTWQNKSADLAGDFIRFEGGNALAFNGGRQSDAMQRITGSITSVWPSGISRSGVFTTLDVAGNRPGTAAANNSKVSFDSSLSTFPNTAKTNDTETRAINRTVRKWRRTA